MVETTNALAPGRPPHSQAPKEGGDERRKIKAKGRDREVKRTVFINTHLQNEVRELARVGWDVSERGRETHVHGM